MKGKRGERQQAFPKTNLQEKLDRLEGVAGSTGSQEAGTPTQEREKGPGSVQHIESESEYTPEIIESPPPGHVETQAGVKGVLVDRDGNYVDIRLPDGTSTWVKIDSLTENSRQVLGDTYSDVQQTTRSR